MGLPATAPRCGIALKSLSGHRHRLDGLRCTGSSVWTVMRMNSQNVGERQNTPEFDARSQAIWREVVTEYLKGPLPFVQCDPDDPELIVSMWTSPTGNDEEDRVRGLFYGELLFHRARRLVRCAIPPLRFRRSSRRSRARAIQVPLSADFSSGSRNSRSPAR